MNTQPVPVPMLTNILVDAIHEANVAEGKRPKAFDTMFRHSDAGKCARQIGFSHLGFDETEPMDLAGHWVTWLGKLIHEEWQQALLKSHANATVEVKVRFGDLTSGHIDALVDIPLEAVSSDEPWTASPILAEAEDGSGHRVLDLDRSRNEREAEQIRQASRVRNDGLGWPGDGQPSDAHPVLRNVPWPYPQGPRGGPSVSTDQMRESEAFGGRDQGGEQEEAGGGGDSLPAEPSLRGLESHREQGWLTDLSGLPVRQQQAVSGTVRVAYELKSRGVTGFDKAAGYWRQKWVRKEPQGPSMSDLIQGSLNAVASNADLLVIGIMGTECLSKGFAEKIDASELDRFMAEWHYSREEFEPLALAELDRLREIAGYIERGDLPPRWGLNDKGYSTTLDPQGDNWECLYCPYRSLCVEAGPEARIGDLRGRLETSDVV